MCDAEKEFVSILSEVSVILLSLFLSSYPDCLRDIVVVNEVK